jgi:hypothetical protein
MTAARRVPWLALGLALAGAAAWTLGPILRAHPWLLRPCLFKATTGLPCLTCGLTRCTLALLEGRPGEAFYWHPVAVVMVMLSPLLAAWDIHRAVKGRPYPPLPESLPPRLALAALLAGTWILQVVRGI